MDSRLSVAECSCVSASTLVEANLIKNSVQLSTTHNDCVQSWSRSAAGLVGGGEVIGLVIRGNLCISNEDPDHAFPGQIQGVGFFDGMFRDTLIEENIILSDVYHGIALYGGIDSIVRNNTVLDMKTGRPGPIWIRTNNHKNGTPSRNVVMEKNITNAVYGATSTVIARDNYLVKVEEYGSVFRDIANFDATIIGSLVPSGVGATPRPVGSTLSVPQLTNGLVVLPPPATTTPSTVPTDPAPVRPTPATTTTPTPVPVPTATTTPTEPVADVPAVTISGIRANQVVTGGMTVEARPTDFIRVRTVQFIIDGVVITTESSRPYSLAGDGGIGKLYAYNTTALRNGQHTLRVVVTGSESQTATAEVVFTVQNVGTTTPTVLVPTPTVVTVPVKTTDVVNVRNSTNQILGTQPVGAVGAKNSAATYTMNDTVYVQVTFATGVSGYVASQYLSSTVTTPIVPNADIQAQITSLLQQVMALQALLAELLRTR